MAGSNSPAQRSGTGKYFRSVKAELRKVVWPTRKELVNYTIVVFILTTFVTILIYLVDGIFARVFNVLLHLLG